MAMRNPSLDMTVDTTGVGHQAARRVQLQGEHGEDLVPVDHVAGGVHGEAAVGVAVVGDAGVGILGDDTLAQTGQVRRATAVVDVQAVGDGVDRHDVRAEAAQRLGGGARGGAVGAVDDHAQPAQRVRRRGDHVTGRRPRSRRRRRAPSPTSAPTGRRQGSPRRASTSSSTRSASLWPPRAKNLMPLSGIGLWLAESMTPRSTPQRPTRWATAGVGSTPTRTTSTPALASPATTAASRNSPLARGSRPTMARGR